MNQIAQRWSAMPLKWSENVLVLGIGLLFLALFFYVGLLGGGPHRTLILDFFFESLLVGAAVHVALVFLTPFSFRWQAQDRKAESPGLTSDWDVEISYRLRAIPVFILFGVTWFVLLVTGGAALIKSFAGLTILALVLLLIGSSVSQGVLAGSRGAVSLAFGIVMLSVLGSYLAAFHLFRAWILAPLLLFGLVYAWRVSGRDFANSARIRCREFLQSPVTVSDLLIWAGLFLFALFIFVAAAAPETKSDAVRVYWPYIKLLKEHGGFFDNPYLWSYIIPQAGLTYSGSLLVLLGTRATRWSMFLIWVLLFALLAEFVRHEAAPTRLRGVKTSVGLGLGLILATAPIMLWVTASLYQDAFVCLVLMLLAIVCVQGETTRPLRFSATVGALVGVAWCTKFTLLAYAAPLAVWAVYRLWKSGGHLLKALPVTAAAALMTALPWLWHSYRQVGNPVFPFLTGVFPSSVWPGGIGKMNLDQFAFADDAWLWWWRDLTYGTSRFCEVPNGGLGLILPTLLVLLVPTLWKGTVASRACILIASLGTALLWSQTAYLRYWLPGLWLGVLAAAPILNGQLARLRPPARTLWTLVVLMICFAQLAIAMVMSWADPKGWPWDFYTQKINQVTYLDRYYPGYATISRVPEIQRDWPRTTVTFFGPVAHLDIEPVEAAVANLFQHRVVEPRASIRFLGSFGSKYWLVDHSSPDVIWMRYWGIQHAYWDPESLVVSAGPLAVYRMKTAEEALQRFDSRAAPGTDLLLDGGFEESDPKWQAYWRTSGRVEWQHEHAGPQKQNAFVRLQPGSLYQMIALPGGLKRLEAAVRGRLAATGAATLQFDMDWKDASEAILGYTRETKPLNAEWTPLRIVADIPSTAAFASLSVSIKDASVPVDVDDCRLQPR
ncbi:MAG: hypothetical protein AB1898_06835 [Acidobacteriota bacterium]